MRITRLRFRDLTRLCFRAIRLGDYHRRRGSPVRLLISGRRAIQLAVSIDTGAVIAITTSSLQFDVDVVQNYHNC